MSLLENLMTALSDIQIVERNQSEYKKAVERLTAEISNLKQTLSKRMEEIQTYQTRFANDMKLVKTWFEELKEAANSNAKDSKIILEGVLGQIEAFLMEDEESLKSLNDKPNPCHEI